VSIGVEKGISRWWTVTTRAFGPVIALCVVQGGCASTPPMRPAVEVAAETERTRCTPDVDESALAPLFSRQAVISAEPLYTASSGFGAAAGGNYSQLIGAIVRIHALRGFTAEWLDRALECYSARRLLGRDGSSVASAQDPFWLPGRTVEIEEPQVERWAEEVAGHHGYAEVSHTLEIFGTCAACQAQGGAGRAVAGA